MAAVEALNTEVELISASILPAETLTSTDSGTWPRIVTVANSESQRSLLITVSDTYPIRGAVTIELKGNDVGRDEAVEWSAQIDAFLDEWDEGDGYVVALWTGNPDLPPDTHCTRCSRRTSSLSLRQTGIP
ncbi:hypothetical protein VHUM_00343 [Vanrija humicola]|uniref:Uncharacterized protein n=1 Tax=Vanrija humicola TaxID=5417 RepID=A0A7D8Z4K0_VANHU|nr:hypothetical protein VHUM_00343 [Vanrija humicola]